MTARLQWHDHQPRFEKGPSPQHWNDFPYDLESYPNVFTAVIIHATSGREWIFEVSDRVNQSRQLLNFIRTMGQHPSNRMVGYNNVGYDYPLLHALLRFDSFTAAERAAKDSHTRRYYSLPSCCRDAGP